MWNFKPGDEVVPVETDEGPLTPNDPRNRLSKNQVYVVEKVVVWLGAVGLVLVENHSSHATGAFLASAFRKVQKPKTTLSISDFLTIKPGQFEEPRRVNAPARKREGVS